MNQEYKLRQEMYHRLNEPDDDISAHNPIIYPNPSSMRLVGDIMDYFSIPVTELIYPSKSYAVAVIYAKLLNIYFGVRVNEALSDPNLLYGNDKYFVPYQVGHSSIVYDCALTMPINKNLPQVAKTIDYFKKEFFLNPNPYFDNSSLINTTTKDHEELEWVLHTR